MGKTYLKFLMLLLCLNFVYKGTLYFTYNKVKGTVTGYMSLTSVSHGNGENFTEETTAPEISYTIGRMTYSGSLRQWGGLYKPNVGDTVELLYKKNHAVPELNRFLQYWLTPLQMLMLLLTSAMGLLISETIKEFKTKNS